MSNLWEIIGQWHGFWQFIFLLCVLVVAESIAANVCNAMICLIGRIGKSK